MTFVDGEEWGRLFRSFERSAWRLETQGVYREPNEQEHLRKFLAGEHNDLDWLREWFDNIRAIRAAGKSFGRVRVLTEPLTEYLRFELAMTPPAVAAGEDIGVLSADRATELGLPDHDFWLFDDRIVARMEFGDQGFVRAELLTEDATVQRHLAWRETARQHATPFTDYARTTPIT